MPSRTMLLCKDNVLSGTDQHNVALGGEQQGQSLCERWVTSLKGCGSSEAQGLQRRRPGTSAQTVSPDVWRASYLVQHFHTCALLHIWMKAELCDALSPEVRT
jgi:hypothetical protein